MTTSDFLIIGGGAAGTTAAETLRAEDSISTITVIENEPYPLYSRVQIPQYLSGMKTREQIFLRSFDSYKEKNINFLHGKTATKIDAENKKVELLDGEVISYKKLLITTGGISKKLNKYVNEMYMQTVDDADIILKSKKTAKEGVVIGSGFIALEFINTFSKYELPTKLCVSNNGFWGNFLERSISEVITNNLIKNGTSVLFGSVPENINNPETMVGVGVGLNLNNELFPNSNIAFDNGLFTNEFLETASKDIYAAGDVAKFRSLKLERTVRYGNWTNALMSGKAAALNMLGKNIPYDMLSAYSISSFDMKIIFLGFTFADNLTKVKTEMYNDSSCAQFFIRNGKLDGCVLINKTEDRQKYQKIIESREDFNL